MSRILIVDDEESIRNTLAAFLDDAGYETETAGNVPAAQQLLKENRFDIVLSDIIMPRVSGVELLQTIRRESPRVQIIMMTGQPTVETAAEAVRAGAFDYLTKPASKETVLRCVANAAKLKAADDERLRLHEQLQANYARLRELEALRDNLTHMIIHDLRAPLAIALGYLDLVKNQTAAKLDGKEAEHLDTIAINLCRLNDMIGSLLDISRLETGNMPLVPRPCDLTALARSVMDSFAPLADARQIVLESPGKPVVANCDEEITRRILGNLLQNALKFTSRHGSIRVAAVWQDTVARLEVADSGRGIPAEFHAQIFEKFGQVDRQARQHSNGLGLAFCKLAVEAQGGRIGVESAPGLGSAFWFTLPTARPAI
jgi:signal transduction histidine kinase